MPLSSKPILSQYFCRNSFPWFIELYHKYGHMFSKLMACIYMCNSNSYNTVIYKFELVFYDHAKNDFAKTIESMWNQYGHFSHRFQTNERSDSPIVCFAHCTAKMCSVQNSKLISTKDIYAQNDARQNNFVLLQFLRCRRLVVGR